MLLGCYTYPVNRHGKSIPPLPGQDLDDQPLPPPEDDRGRGEPNVAAAEGAEIAGPVPVPDEMALDAADPNIDQVRPEVIEDDAEDDDDVPHLKRARSLYTTWHRLVEEAEDFSMKQVTLVEVIKTRNVKYVLPAIASMHARLRSLGLPVYRIHSDRARELCSEQVQAWALDRQIVSTLTPGSSYKANGRVEGEMNTIKKSMRTLITAGACPADRWPLVARHVGERRLRSQLHQLGWPTGRLLRFGCQAFALKKSWQNRYEQWRNAREEVRVMGPAINSSLTNTSYFVQSVATNRFFYTDDIVMPDWNQPAIEEQVIYLPELPGGAPRPTRRVRGKTSPLSLSTLCIEGETSIWALKQLRTLDPMFEPLPPMMLRAIAGL